MKRRPILILGGIAAGLIMTAGSCDRRGLGDAPVGKLHESPVQVWVAPDTFMNVGAFCIGPNGIYVHSRPAPPIVVKDDANCAEGGLLAGEDS